LGAPGLTIDPFGPTLHSGALGEIVTETLGLELRRTVGTGTSGPAGA
jgi:hypothetical protein